MQMVEGEDAEEWQHVGLLARLKAALHRTPLPTALFVNATSLTNKMDELLLDISTHKTTRHCCLFWRFSSILDTVKLDSGKKKGE